MTRARFAILGAAAQAALSPAAALAQAPAHSPQPPRAPTQALARALVFSGGGALGAYEAGVVSALLDEYAVGEGQPLGPYGVVCGTSIGAFNAYLVATGQYAKLRDLWSTIARENVVHLKPQFAKITTPSSGLGNRVFEAVGLASGLFKDVKGVLDGESLRKFLLEYFDLTRPVVIPMIWAVTNLTLQSPEYFVLAADNASPETLEVAFKAIHVAVGRNVPVRLATRAMLVDQLRASAAVPLAFDPVVLPGPDGKAASYVDGGVTANTPANVARALARRVDAIMLNPPFEPQTYNNAVEISVGSFDTMQRRLIEDTLRIAYLEIVVLRALKQLPASFTEQIAQLAGVSPAELQLFEGSLSETLFYLMRPKKDLPATLFGFDDEKAIAETYAIGREDGKAGFQLFNPVDVSGV